MCDGLGQPANVTEALVMLDRALDHLTSADTASLPTSIQAGALRALGRAAAKHTAAQARMLAAFTAQDGYEADGLGGARAWLRWHTRVTSGAAAGAVGWARRLAAHPVIGDSLAAGEVSESWAKQICAWTDRLPEGRQEDADEILAAAARGGVDLAGLAGLAREMYERSHRDRDTGDGSGERALWLDTTFGGAGRLTGDLTPGCSAALTAVLAALGKRAGPEDLRTALQRRHDALEEACQRLIASGMLPGRAGQPSQVHLHMSLAQLRDLPGSSAAEAAWATAKASQPGWVTGAEAEGAACDATTVPIVTGHVDWTALDHLTDIYLAARLGTTPPAGVNHPAPGQPQAGQPAQASSPVPAPGQVRPRGAAEPSHPADLQAADLRAGDLRAGDLRAGDLRAGDLRAGDGQVGDGQVGDGQVGDGQVGDGQVGDGQAGARDRAGSASGGRSPSCGCTCGGCHHPPASPLSPATRQRLRQALLALAIDALSGPEGLAARLRAGLDGRSLTAPSMPLDVGAATEVIPAHLRRAVTTRHHHCAFPGCAQPASVCEVHHIIPRSRGGPTALFNLLPVCRFHHLTVIHRWGWALHLHADGTTAATAPDGRTLHSHSPPRQAA